MNDLTLPSSSEIAASSDLMPYIEKLEAFQPEDEDSARRKLEAAMALEAVARARRLRDQQNRIEAEVTRTRALIGRLMPERDRGGRGGKNKPGQQDNVRQPVDLQKEGERNRKLGEVDPEKLNRTIDGMLERGETPSRGRVLRELGRGRYNAAPGDKGNEWFTPPDIATAARAVLGEIDLDPASCEEANGIIKAQRWMGSGGLEAAPWVASTIFLNPPYSDGRMVDWVRTLTSSIVAGHATAAILLVNANTETAWGQAAIEDSAAVCFPRGRLAFVRPGGDRAGTGRVGQMILYYGPLAGDFVMRFKAFGPVLLRNPPWKSDAEVNAKVWERRLEARREGGK